MKFGQEESVRSTHVFEVDGETTLEEIKATVDELTAMFGMPDEDLVAPWSYHVTRTKQQFDNELFLDTAGTWRVVRSDEKEPTITFLVMFCDKGMAALFKLAYC